MARQQIIYKNEKQTLIIFSQADVTNFQRI